MPILLQFQIWLVNLNPENFEDHHLAFIKAIYNQFQAQELDSKLQKIIKAILSNHSRQLLKIVYVNLTPRLPHTDFSALMTLMTNFKKILSR